MIYPFQAYDDWKLIKKLLDFAPQLIDPLDDETRELLGKTTLPGYHFTLKVNDRDRSAPAKPEFKLGDVVALKSGGPRMTIERVYPAENEGYVELAWFEMINGSWRLQKATGPTAGLYHVEKFDPTGTIPGSTK